MIVKSIEKCSKNDDEHNCLLFFKTSLGENNVMNEGYLLFLDKKYAHHLVRGDGHKYLVRLERQYAIER